MGTNVAREFNLDDRQLFVRFLVPLLSEQDLQFEGHDFIARKTRITILEGPELRPDELGIAGRGWQNAVRNGTDVTEVVLERARDHLASTESSDAPAAKRAALPGSAALRERLIGRLLAGPIALEEIRTIAHDLMPDASADELRAASDQAAVDLLNAGEALLTR
jgi:hypothetical protein